jgi:hypothetical protein
MAWPFKQTVWLVVIFVIFPAVIWAVIFYVFKRPEPILFIMLWNFLLAAAYIISYPAIQVESPSLKVISTISLSMPGGMTFKEIRGIIPESVLILDSLDKLVAEGFICRKEDKYIISSFGRLVSLFFILYRKLFWLPVGEG